MKKGLKILASALTVLMVSTALIGCGSGNNSSGKGKNIVVWSHLNDSDVKALDKIGQEWAKKTGNSVKFVTDKSDFQAYTAAAQSSKGPDIMFGMPHNDIGVFQKAGLLDEVPSGIINDGDYAAKSALDAVTWSGKRYAVPIAMETYALFYNTDKVKEAPKTTDELEEQAKKVGFKYDINNIYFSYGWISGNGGYIFKNNNGTLDPKDIGLGNEGAIKGYQFIQDLVVKDKLMNADITGDIAKGDFTAKKIGFYITGAWDIEALQKVGIPFAVAPLPTINGSPAKSFMTVQGAFVSSKSKNKSEAWDLMKYLTAKSGTDVIYKVRHSVPVLNADLEQADFKNDKIVSAFAEQAKVAEPMPNIPEMNTVWTPTGNNLKLLTQGKQDAAKTAKSILDQVADGIKQMK